MLELDEGVSARLVRLLVLDHVDLLDRTVCLEFAAQLRLRGVEIDPERSRVLVVL